MPITRLLKGPQTAAEDRQAIVCVGLALEAKIVTAQFRSEVGCSEFAALSEAGRAAVAGCRAIVSFGLAGGLSPRLRPGDVVIASNVVAHDRNFPTDDAWSGWLLRAIPQALYAPIAGVDSAISAKAPRRELGLRSGALAVDMESHIIGQFAARHAMRFVAVRVVIDTVERRLPRAALACVASNGETRIAALCRLLAARPGDALDILRLWTDWLPARRALVDCCEVLSASVGEG